MPFVTSVGLTYKVTRGVCQPPGACERGHLGLPFGLVGARNAHSRGCDCSFRVEYFTPPAPVSAADSVYPSGLESFAFREAVCLAHAAPQD